VTALARLDQAGSIEAVTTRPRVRTVRRPVEPFDGEATDLGAVAEPVRANPRHLPRCSPSEDAFRCHPLDSLRARPTAARGRRITNRPNEGSLAAPREKKRSAVGQTTRYDPLPGTHVGRRLTCSAEHPRAPFPTVGSATHRRGPPGGIGDDTEMRSSGEEPRRPTATPFKPPPSAGIFTLAVAPPVDFHGADKMYWIREPGPTACRAETTRATGGNERGLQ